MAPSSLSPDRPREAPAMPAIPLHSQCGQQSPQHIVGMQSTCVKRVQSQHAAFPFTCSFSGTINSEGDMGDWYLLEESIRLITLVTSEIIFEIKSAQVTSGGHKKWHSPQSLNYTLYINPLPGSENVPFNILRLALNSNTWNRDRIT